MEEITLKIQFAFFIVIALSGIVLLIFCLKRKQDREFNWEYYKKIIRLMDEQTEENLDMLTKMNKKKDKLEEKIRDKKKKLRMSLVSKK